MSAEELYKEMLTFMARGLEIEMRLIPIPPKTERRFFEVIIREYFFEPTHGLSQANGIGENLMEAWDRAKRQLARAVIDNTWGPRL